MGAAYGLDSALWFAPKGVEPQETPTYRRSNAFPHVREECLAVRSAVGLYETSNYGKYEISGAGARAFLDRILACKMPRPGRMTLAPMLNAASRVVGDLTLACLAEDRYLLIGSGFVETFHLRWFAGQSPPDNVHIRSLYSSLHGFSIAGPRARDLVQRLVREDLSNGAFKFFTVKETAIGMSPGLLSRAGFTGELGYEIWVAPDFLAQLYDDLIEAGQDLGVRLFGGRALSSLRLEKAYGSFQKDFRPDYTVAETGLDAFVDFSKPAFTGRDAALRERDQGPKRRFVALKVDALDADVVGYESILKDGTPVGHVTSGGYGHFVGTSIAMGYVPAALAKDGESFIIDILGAERPATVTRRALHDPDGLRLRS